MNAFVSDERRKRMLPEGKIPLLRMEDISKSFPGIQALREVNFELWPREVHVLVGQNGAGKSTLIKILSGAYRPDAGKISIDGKPVEHLSPHTARQLGIATIYQEFNLIPDLSVAENIMVTSWQMRRRFLVIRGQIEHQAAAVMSKWGIDIDPHMPAGGLTPGQKREVVILRALCIDPQLVVLEEPLADLSSVQAVSQIMWLIRRIVERNLSVLYMARRPSNAMQVADRITVLRDGQVAGSWERTGFEETAMLTATLSQRMGELGDFEGELTEEPSGFLGSLRSSFGRIFGGDR